MTVTIKDVAKLANVAPSTVSRVIANSPRISGKTKERVKEAMEELGYHPNFIARSLASQSTQAIGLVMPSSSDLVFQNPFFPTALSGLSQAAHEKNYALHMTTGKTEDEIFDGVVHMVQGKRVDGVILLYSKVEDKVISYLQKRDFPFVVIGKPYKHAEQITHVDNDNFRATKEVTEYLIQMGHEHIAFVGGNLDFVVTVERLLGYERALRDSYLPLENDYIVHEEFLREGGQEAVRGLMSLEKPPTALVVADDLMALGVLNMLDEMGISVPEDISIVSFNNVLLAEMSRPPLTSVDINIYDLGYEAAKNLIQKIENPKEPNKRIIIPHKLIKRQSCGEHRTKAKILT
ncbi:MULTISPECIES: LacI family DNA-binding transcriptional regulator [unclassified Bacillus (in: firmicutes)]|uniref:LacI family DNA-binding transcriptional regulator n=1 Tax=unclassified Bacillus (in: firmicutes) TaxID=185979 RepID=UPI0008F09733|nr:MULTISPECIES: LacI family DNA-binding transcriptional regulator [unclassified Bacillus (in: firmicutes)]SFA79164.1 DNA-binding transcriptional regulator, LacI/PurR family [Bacillus sp. UNCCL13]SFQ69119.1 DNA-binding transcriptional regulator, LacI/PurR family [Bacillus sp. cl95]